MQSKILYKCIKKLIQVPYGSIICCTYHQLKYSSPNRTKKTQKTRATQKSLPFATWRLWEKEVRRPKTEKDKTENVHESQRAIGLGRREKGEDIEKRDQTDNRP